MIFKDFALDDTGDLLIKDGDFVVLPSDMQHISDIIDSFAGYWKQFPTIGVGLMQYLKSQNPSAVTPIIKQQLQSDGYVVGQVNVTINNGQLKVEFPKYSIQRNT